MTAPTIVTLPDPVEPVTVEPVRRRVTPRVLTAEQRVIDAHRREPTATHERIAELAGCSVSTVKRYRPGRSLSGSSTVVQTAETAPAERVNGVPPVASITVGPVAGERVTAEPVSEPVGEPVELTRSGCSTGKSLPVAEPVSEPVGEPVEQPTRKPVVVWPVVLLAMPAFVAVWSGWVGLGELTGFGVVHPLPGIADGFSINSAITLPIGMEVYAAYALYVWLSGRVPDRARRFAKWSALGSLLVGALGQIAYHLLAAAGVTAAPWWITTAVACLPVAVLGMGAALAHLVREDVA